MEKYNCAETFPDDGDELSLLDILIVLAEQKKLIVAITLLFAVAGFGYTTFVKDTTPRYRSDVQVLAVNLSGAGNDSISIPGKMVDALVSSTAMMKAVTDKIDVVTADGQAMPKETARGYLHANTKVDVGRNGLVTISVTSPSSEQSMKIATLIFSLTEAALLDMGVAVTPNAPDAAIEVNKNPIVFQLVSPASMPAGPEAQGRGKVIVLATMLGFFCAVTAAFARHFWAAADDPETTEKKNYLKKLLGFKPKA